MEHAQIKCVPFMGQCCPIFFFQKEHNASMNGIYEFINFNLLPSMDVLCSFWTPKNAGINTRPNILAFIQQHTGIYTRKNIVAFIHNHTGIYTRLNIVAFIQKMADRIA